MNDSSAVGMFFSKLRDHSKSPNLFSSVASTSFFYLESLSKQKQTAHIPKKRNPLAISNFNKSRFGASSATKSIAVPKGIFAAPPNPKLKPRTYEGQLVLSSTEFGSLSESILKLQGHRRFKVSHFKSKYILYEDEYIQIGFKV